MKSIFKVNLYFLIPFITFVVAGAGILALNSKTNLHLTFNLFHNRFFDIFFYYITYLGDGFMTLLAFIILLTVKYKNAFLVGLSGLIASIITQLLKRHFFFDTLRPKKFFEGLHELYLVPGIENHSYFSFPSGHATTAFALYFSLALLVTNNGMKLIFFIVALLTAYSRVYLSQHFFEDIYAGALIGVAVTYIVFNYLKTHKAIWINGSIVSYFKQ